MEDGPDAISLGLFNNYYQFMALTSDKQPGENVTVNYFTLIYGIGAGSSDWVVTNGDADAIFNTITSTNKQKCWDDSTHEGLPDDNDVEDIIKKRLRGETLPWYYLCSSS